MWGVLKYSMAMVITDYYNKKLTGRRKNKCQSVEKWSWTTSSCVKKTVGLARGPTGWSGTHARHLSTERGSMSGEKGRSRKEVTGRAWKDESADDLTLTFVALKRAHSLGLLFPFLSHSLTLIKVLLSVERRVYRDSNPHLFFSWFSSSVLCVRVKHEPFVW